MHQYALTDLNQINSKEWQSGGQNRRICPNCGDTKPHDKDHASFIFHPETGKYECKRCSVRGTLIDFWESIAKCPYCATEAEGIQRAKIWKQWKDAGRIAADRAKAEEAADQVIGLAIDEQTGAWKCRSCQATGQLRNYSGKGSAKRASYAERKADQEREKARAIIAALTTGATELPDPTDAEWLAVWENASPIEQGRGRDYLQFRGIEQQTGQTADVRYSEHWGRSEKWAGHPAILFPFRDKLGQLVAVAARYIDPPKWCAAHRTYGAKAMGVFVTGPEVWKAETVAITEAPIDALAIANCFGVPAIACGGTSWPDWLPYTMMFKRVILASDNDDAGDKMAAKLGADLAMFTHRIERVKPEGAKDWGEVAQSPEKVEAMRARFAFTPSPVIPAEPTPPAPAPAPKAARRPAVPDPAINPRCDDCGALLEPEDKIYLLQRCARCDTYYDIRLSHTSWARRFGSTAGAETTGDFLDIFD